jgi:hypothetical protein
MPFFNGRQETKLLTHVCVFRIQMRVRTTQFNYIRRSFPLTSAKAAEFGQPSGGVHIYAPPATFWLALEPQNFKYIICIFKIHGSSPNFVFSHLSQHFAATFLYITYNNVTSFMLTRSLIAHAESLSSSLNGNFIARRRRHTLCTELFLLLSKTHGTREFVLLYIDYIIYVCTTYDHHGKI